MPPDAKQSGRPLPPRKLSLNICYNPSKLMVKLCQHPELAGTVVRDGQEGYICPHDDGNLEVTPMLDPRFVFCPLDPADCPYYAAYLAQLAISNANTHFRGDLPIHPATAEAQDPYHAFTTRATRTRR